jgi:hypothetical protein
MRERPRKTWRMNNVKRTLIILFSMAALSAFAEVPLLLVNISGTVEIQHTLSPDDSRTQSSRACHALGARIVCTL